MYIYYTYIFLIIIFTKRASGGSPPVCLGMEFGNVSRGKNS